MSNEAPNNTDEQSRPLNVLIIADKHSQLAPAAAFLTRRGVPCTVKGNIKDGLQHITSQKVTLVFLSFNLPGANIIRTHQIITENFKAECVVFAEKTDGKTSAEVNALRGFETMQAPVSGPGLYMRIQKLYKAKGALDKLEKLVKLKEPPSMPEQEEDKFINVGNTNVKNDGPNSINFQKDKNFTEEMEAETGETSTKELTARLDDDNNETNAITQEGIKPGETHTVKTSHVSSKKIRTKKEPASYGSVVNIYKNADPKDIVKPPAGKRDGVLLGFKPRTGTKDSNSLLAQKTFEAIEKSVRPAFVDYKGVELVNKAKIFNIHTPKFKGYLIFVVPMSHELDKKVVASIRDNLEKSLKEENENLLFFEELNIEIEEKNFLGWAQENADFFIQTVDNKTEIICAYYPFENSLPKLEDAHNEEMSLIDIKDLKQNTQPNVNLYIHLPKNNKFVCYMKPGDTITDRHMEKFEKHKVSNLHIKNEEVTPFKQYFVAYQLQQIIKKKSA